ncbi:MAG: hypothetical protein AAB871_01515 [Patescibacteria group bacterium]
MGNCVLGEHPYRTYYAIFNDESSARQALDRIADDRLNDVGIRHIASSSPDDGNPPNPRVIRVTLFHPLESDLRALKEHLGACDISQNYSSVPC